MDQRIQNIMAAVTMEFLYKNRMTSVHAINHGWCWDWANKVAAQLPGAEVCWDEEMPVEMRFSHCFVLYNGRYYDAEATNGVKDWTMLPSFLSHTDRTPQPCCLEEKTCR